MSNRIQVNPKLFEWAQVRSQKSEDELCTKFPKFQEWKSGDLAPTAKQLEKFAAQTYTPFGYFFLEEPPEENLPIPDFRTVTDRGVPRPSPHLLDTLYAIQERQEWMRNFLIEQGEPPVEFIGSRDLRDNPNNVANDIRQKLELGTRWSRNLNSWEEALRYLIQKIEDAGVLVMINGVVENNTRRPLNVEEFRGFALSDTHAPVIFINGKDAKAAQMFTLIHELAHLWIGRGGVSDFHDLLPSSNKVEIFCNKVAAEFLVPAAELRIAWKDISRSENPFGHLARTFKISPIVAARRALDLELITREDYFGFYSEYKKTASERKKSSKGGGDFYRTLGTRLGKRFPAAVYIATKEGSLSYREAFQLTGLTGASYDQFGKKFGFAL